MIRDSNELIRLAKQVMVDRGLEPDFPEEALDQSKAIQQPASANQECVDLTSYLWCSIDNDDSRDLDQLTFAKKGDDGKTTIWVAVANVEALVSKNSPIDNHAITNTTSVYTPAKVFPMLPENLSTNLTSLNENENRLAIVIQVELSPEGETENSTIFQALVHNYAQLAYPSTGAWLEGTGKIPEKISKIPGLEQTLLCQYEAAKLLKSRRNQLGALTLASSKAEVKIQDKEAVFQIQEHQAAHHLIEEFMIAANCAMAKYMRQAQVPFLNRVVKIPRYWDKIVRLAASYGEGLPYQPDSVALNEFLMKMQAQDPDTFPDLSLTVIKLLGRGEYIVEKFDSPPVGHFGLALPEYTHATAPNRRFPDLIAQRQYIAHLVGRKYPYSIDELQILAGHCTSQEDAAMKVERQTNKSAAAMLLSDQIGSTFKGIITGSDEKGTWVRIYHPPVEGRLIPGFRRFDIGDKVTVKLAYVDIPKGYIDFVV